jgi:ATP-binding cassette subfamily C (CFTR/MRP) protein 1
MSWFDTTPMGRVVARFSKDMDMMDNSLPGSWDMTMMMLFLVFISVLATAISTPLYLVVAGPVFAVYIRISFMYRNVVRELKRLDSLARSPVYAQFTETLGGLAGACARAGGAVCMLNGRACCVRAFAAQSCGPSGSRARSWADT